MTSGPTVDDENAAFWNELCGTSLARQVGVTGRSADDLRRFDDAYLHFYPYLDRYLPEDLTGERVLEVGLGYGTLGQVIAERGAQYTGVDVAAGPVAMMRHRMVLIGRSDCEARQASVLELPFDDAMFDRVVTVGCLHHTGDLRRAMTEVSRVLRPGGHALVMVYNKWSARRLLAGPALLLRRVIHRSGRAEAMRGLYDKDQSGAAAPHTEFVSRRALRALFDGWRDVRIDRRNLSFGRIAFLRRPALTVGLDRIAGLDLYAQAVR